MLQSQVRRHLSLPSVVGRDGVEQVLEPTMSDTERQALDHSAAAIREALSRLTLGGTQPKAV